MTMRKTTGSEGDVSLPSRSLEEVFAFFNLILLQVSFLWRRSYRLSMHSAGALASYSLFFLIRGNIYHNPAITAGVFGFLLQLY